MSRNTRSLRIVSSCWAIAHSLQPCIAPGAGIEPAIFGLTNRCFATKLPRMKPLSHLPYWLTQEPPSRPSPPKSLTEALMHTAPVHLFLRSHVIQGLNMNCSMFSA